MTTPSSAFPQGAREQIDTGPLSWVMGEIREALTRSKTALYDAVTQDAEARSTSLRHAKSYLHQAHGALQIVDIDGVVIITETVEDLLDRVDAGQLAYTRDLAQAVDQGYQALIEYLEELLSGMSHQPVRLFPYYRALLEARGAERIHPADLFFPNLAVRPQLPAAVPARPMQASDYAGLRQRFERALLPFLRSSERGAEQANAAAMRDIIAKVERAQSNPQSRAFWWVMHGLAEAVSGGQIQKEIYVKQLFARINLQIRRLSQGSSSIAERLLRDALFFISQASEPSPRVREIRAAYRLDGLVPSDYEKKRYGQIDVDALAAAKERLAQAKAMWNRIAGGDASVADTFEHEMHMLAETGAKLNSAPLTKLLRELSGISRHATRTRAGDSLSLEMATSLLFIENSLSRIGRLSDNFAERAEAMTARLLAIVSGEQPTESAQWLDDMSREAQQRQTMTALSTEMQASLRQVEKMLDEYFRDPSQAGALSQLDLTLHQIEGALAILDQDDAVRTVQHTRAAVQRFAAGDASALSDPQESQRVAQNVGALSFFIETLQHNNEGAAKQFAFDAERGVFRANLVEKPAAADEHAEGRAPSAAESGNIQPEMPAGEMPTVEDELALHQQQSAELAMSLSAEPDNAMLQEQLKESLEQIRLDATLVDNPEANDRAQAVIDILDRPDFAVSRDAMAEIITATVPLHSAEEAAPLPPLVAPETDEAIDAELLEIFLMEAVEVLACVRETIPQSRNEPHNQEHLTTLRRSFHTLKGSGRMVGLTAFGEGAWSIEQVLNLRLSEARSGDPDLYALLEKAAEILGGWVADLRASGRSGRTQHALVAAAERVKSGGGFYIEEDPVAPFVEKAAVENVPAVQAPAERDAAQEAAPDVLPGEAAADFSFSLDAHPEAAADADADATHAGDERAVSFDDFGSSMAVQDMPESLAGFDAAEDVPAALPEIQEIQLSDEELAMFHPAEAAGTSTGNVQPSEYSESPMAAQPAAPVAEVIDFPGAHMAEARQNESVKRIGDLEISVPLHNIYLAETDELVRLLLQDIAEWRHEPERPVSVQSVHAAHSLAGSSATVGFHALQEVAHALELVLQTLARTPVELSTHEFDTLEHSVERLKLMLQKFALGEMPVHEPEYVRLLQSLRQDIEARLAQQAKAAADPMVFDASEGSGAGAEDFAGFAPAAPLPLDAEQSLAESQKTLSSLISAAPFAEPVYGGDNDGGADPALVLNDELDADLLPVFLEEGRDMLPQVGQVLRSWQEQPSDHGRPQALLRLLHTLKGSARMAGAMALGQHLHNMETRIENIMRLGDPAPHALEDLLIRYDQGLLMFEELQNPGAARQNAGGAQTQQTQQAFAPSMDENKLASSQPVELSPLMPLASGRLQATQAPAPVARAANAPANPGQMVRVRADILDRLVNQAGEVSISRSKLETEVDTMRQSLSELTENVARLRDQLREIEMQAETQIASRMAHSADREFDPLEFDRFTRLQELTRMMAESVNDVSSVQQNLSRTIDGASTDLSMQARLTRDLQQDLMRVRMVPFASISERLFRVTRQAAKEVDKRVNLDIRGSAVEIDRGVLEKMTGPFEHLLRNAIVHGIETREARRAAGKSDTGELLVEIRQEGNEVVIQFSDDGQGLNVGRIRNKAREVGLITEARDMPDEEVMDLIFHPGFSTAEEITELAGRGVGMDVVRSEAAALGGRVSTHSEPGRGAHFTIHLPLTLAVTQVVLLSCGGTTYALPSVLVEQVQQLKANPLAAAYNDGAVVWQGQRVAMHYLSALLGETRVAPVAQQYSPLMILKSGNDRVAIHVDEVLGNREVVVKNIGPQLSRMIGIAGATVLGSGDIVLILNPVPLAQRAAHDNVRAPRISPSDAPDAMGAVAEMSGAQPAVPAAEPVQGLRTQNIVMVVDDSLTVRRVTQRLLSREGYQVVQAKDGVDALEQLQAVTPDVMLIDIEMPRMDGFDLTRNVRDDERTRHIPIIMITSRTAAKHRNYAMELGVNEYLGKPYREDDLLKLIAGFVGKEVPAA